MARSNGKHCNKNTAYQIATKGDISFYRTTQNTFFVVIKHEKGEPLDLDFIYIEPTVLGRYGEIVKTVEPKVVEEWVKENCSDRYPFIYGTEEIKPFKLLITLDSDEIRALNKIACFDERKRSKQKIIEEIVRNWLLRTERKIDKEASDTE